MSTIFTHNAKFANTCVKSIFRGTTYTVRHISAILRDTKLEPYQLVLDTKLEPYQYKGTSEQPSMLIQNQHMDTTIWNDVTPDDGDIFITSPAKCGTTWTHEIVAQLLYNGRYQQVLNIESVWEISVWAALSIFPKEDKITFLQNQLENPDIPRRVIKGHEPVESMPFNPNAKYIFVGRDYRDIIWSIHNHYSLFTDYAHSECDRDKDYPFTKLLRSFDFKSSNEYDLWNVSLTTATPDDGNPDGAPLWSQLWTAGSWWNVRNEPNIKVLHYTDLQNDLAGNIRDIARFLEIEIDEHNFENIVNNCSFSAMKNKQNPLGVHMLPYFTDTKRFFNRGGQNLWTDVLTDQDTENYRHVARRYLCEDGIHWMETGKFD
eukprot:504677_1